MLSSLTTLCAGVCEKLGYKRVARSTLRGKKTFQVLQIISPLVPTQNCLGTRLAGTEVSMKIGPSETYGWAHFSRQGPVRQDFLWAFGQDVLSWEPEHAECHPGCLWLPEARARSESSWAPREHDGLSAFFRL